MFLFIERTFLCVSKVNEYEKGNFFGLAVGRKRVDVTEFKERQMR